MFKYDVWEMLNLLFHLFKKYIYEYVCGLYGKGGKR